jgi:hypothetical protein
MAILNIFKKSQKSPPKVSEAEGQDYIISNFNYITAWDTQNLTVTDIEKYKDHWAADLIRESLKNMIFQGDPVINVLDGGKSREDLAEFIRNVADKIDLLTLMKTQYDDECNYGTFLRSVGYAKVGNEVTIDEVRCLPPNTFKNAAQYSSIDYVYGQLLKGIVKDSDGNIHYWQETAYQMKQVELLNCEHFKSPKSSYYLDGVPILNPFYQLAPDLNIVKAGLMQANKRANILFIKDSSKIDLMPDGKGSRWGYMGEILRKLSNNVWFRLPAEMDPVEVKGQVSNISIDSINLIIKLILMCYSPSSFLSIGETNRLGGSTTGESTLMKSYIISQQSHIKKTWEQMFEKLLELNYYPGIKVQIIMPQIKEDNGQLNFQIGQELLASLKAGLTIAEINEIREKFGMEDISIKALLKAHDEIKQVKTDAPMPNNNLNTPIVNNPADSSKNTMDDTTQIKENQAAIKTRETIESETKDDLFKAISDCFEDLETLRA